MKRRTPATRVWLSLFALWGVFLSGVAASLIGPPGVLQSLRLRSLLDSKRTQVAGLEVEIRKLEEERVLLEGSRDAQEREIRRVLGYAAPDEIIFDFTAAERLPSSN
jgi:cell division protein FtsB